ncbi:hypothetical protein [Streptomyces sp. NPDC060027]|uniref:hypothetical protein n=1 Tax=Streptomyces sp. NPDC060027 TaxID=3347040 RepID=UPI003699056C
MIDLVNASPALAMLLGWSLAALTVISICVVACRIALATIKASDRGELATCFRALAELIRACRRSAR